MRRTAFSLVELLVALAVGSLLLLGTSRLLSTAVRSSKMEGATFKAQQEALAALDGLQKEVKDKGIGAIFPGSTENLLSLVLLPGNGHPVIRKGYGPDKIQVALSGPLEFGVGDTVYLRNVAGQGALFTVTATRRLDSDTWEVSLGGCSANPVVYSENTRVFRAEVMTLENAGGTLRLTTKDGTVDVAQLPDFKVGYVYRTPDAKETLLPAYQGRTLNSGAKIEALSLFAKGDLAGNRALTARIYLPSTVGEVVPCGGQTPTLGKGVVTVVVDPAPPGGGDLTLGASGYSKDFRTTTTFHDVPAGTVSVTAREVWTDALTLWAPNPSSWTGTLYAFYPVSVAVGYSKVPGTVTFAFPPIPPGNTVPISGLPGYREVPVGQALQVEPGTWRVSVPPQVEAISQDGCRTVYRLVGPDAQTVVVKSRTTQTVSFPYEPASACLGVKVVDTTGWASSSGVKPTVRVTKAR